MEPRTFFLISTILLILLFSIKMTEKFYNPPSAGLFEFKPVNNQAKYNNYDPVRFHSRLYIKNSNDIKSFPYLEDDKDYHYGYEIPEIMNFTKYSAQKRYEKGLKGVDINTKEWPPLDYYLYKS